MYGRRLRRWPVVVAAVLLVGVCGVYYAARGHLPRTGRVSQWFDWPSARLHAWAMTNQRWSMMRYELPMLRIARIDPAKGTILRTVLYKPIQRSDGKSWYGQMEGLRDNHVFVYWRSGVVEIDAQSGRMVRELDVPEALAGSWAGITDIALHPSRKLLYAYVDFRAALACDLQTGQWSEVVSFPERSKPLTHSLFPLDDADTVILRRALATRQPESGFDLIDLNWGETVLTERTAKHDLSQVVGIAGDALLLTDSEFLGVKSQSVTEQTISHWSPEMAVAEDILVIPLRRIASIESGASGLLYFSGYPVNAITAAPATIAIYDPQSKSYLTPLQLPPRTGDMKLSISPDEHWALTWHPEPTAGPCLYIFDLQAIHGGASPQPAR